MSRLFDAMQARANAVFGAVYLDGTLHRATMMDNGKGGWERSFADVPVKGMIDQVTEAMRQQAGYTDRDVRIILLSGSLDAAPTTNDQVTLRGTRWSIAAPTDDPVQAGYVMRGTPV